MLIPIIPDIPNPQQPQHTASQSVPGIICSLFWFCNINISDILTAINTSGEIPSGSYRENFTRVCLRDL